MDFALSDTDFPSYATNLGLQLQNALPRSPFTTCKVMIQADGDVSSEPLSLRPGTSATEKTCKRNSTKDKSSGFFMVRGNLIPLSFSGLPLHP